MLGKRVPLFEKGNILTKEMLDSLRNYAISSREVDYTGYSNGILKGCKINITDDFITINKGILIFHETAYYITEPCSISYKPTNQWMILKASLLGEVVTDNFIIRDMDISLIHEEQLGKDDIEICRFRLQPGAKLRNQYTNFLDLNTAYDTVCEIYANWAAYGNPSVSYTILHMFLKEAFKHSLTDMRDILFCQQLSELKGETLNLETISMYICSKTDKNFKLLNNLEIYEGLREIINQLSGGVCQEKKVARKERKILID